jgi:hypothetical protein
VAAAVRDRHPATPAIIHYDLKLSDGCVECMFLLLLLVTELGPWGGAETKPCHICCSVDRVFQQQQVAGPALRTPGYLVVLLEHWGVLCCICCRFFVGWWA